MLNSQEKKAVAQAIVTLSKVKGFNIPKDVLGACVGAIAQYDSKAILGAIQNLLSEDFPQRSMIPKIIELVDPQNSTTGLDKKASDAYEELIRLTGQAYAWRITTPGFKHEDPALVHAVAISGGWEYVIKQSPEDLAKYVRPGFLRAYKDYAQDDSRQRAMIPYGGLGIAKTKELDRLSVTDKKINFRNFIAHNGN